MNEDNERATKRGPGGRELLVAGALFLTIAGMLVGVALTIVGTLPD